MDICANVRYNKVLEADPLELLEVGRGVLGSRPRQRNESKSQIRVIFSLQGSTVIISFNLHQIDSIRNPGQI